MTTCPGAAAGPLHLARRMSLMPPSAVREILKIAERPDIISFAGGLPAPELFPLEPIAAAFAQVLSGDGRAALQYSVTEGFGPLREWILQRLDRRNIRAGLDQIIITSGSQQGIDLVARALLDPGDAVVVENPGYLAATQTFAGYEARLLPVGSDDDGMDVEDVERAVQAGPVKLIYLVPDFHNPKGTTLSLERRRRLLKLAQTHRIAVIEDDPYGELRFRGEAPSSLAALDDTGVVIHLGTFSKTLAPGLRLGWLVGPKEVVRAATIAKQAADLHTGTLVQRAVAWLLARFDYDAHLTRLRAVYSERCQTMLRALESHMPAGARWTRPDGGLFIWAQLPSGLGSDEIFADALGQKVAFVPGGSFFTGERRRDFMRLNYSYRSPDSIEEGMARLGRVVKAHLR